MKFPQLRELLLGHAIYGGLGLQVTDAYILHNTSIFPETANRLNLEFDGRRKLSQLRVFLQFLDFALYQRKKGQTMGEHNYLPCLRKLDQSLDNLFLEVLIQR